MENKKPKIELTMNMLLYMDDFFEKLKTLKEDETETIACITFSKDKENKIYVDIHMNKVFEILVFPYKNEISSIMQRLAELIDSLSDKDFIKSGNLYELCNFIIKPNEEIFEIQLAVEKFVLDYLLEDECKTIAGEISDLLDRMENRCINIFNRHVLNQEN